MSLLLAGACGRVVGAECIDGYELCEDVCCPTGMCSPNGVCLAGDGGPGDGGDLDGGESFDGDTPRDGDIVIDGFVDGFTDPDMGPPGCPLGTSQCGDECVDLDFDENNCGDCGVECPAGEFCALGECVGTCDPPLIDCGGVCVDPTSDPTNCGACGNVCESAICRPGGCLSASASDVMLVGHDFDEDSIAATTLTGNGALLRLEEPVRIAVYEGTVSADNRARIIDAIDTIANEAGRSYVLVPATERQVATRLRRADTFLVMPQENATDESLRASGQMWAAALATFIERGGAILVLDGSGEHSGTWQILDEARLLDVDGRVAVEEDAVCTTVTPTDSLANEVPINYAAPRDTVAFTGVTEGEVVTAPVEGLGDLPVAVHRFIAPPEPDP